MDQPFEFTEEQASSLDGMTKEWAGSLSERIEELQLELPGGSRLQEHTRLSFAKPHSEVALALPEPAVEQQSLVSADGGHTVGPVKEERDDAEDATQQDPFAVGFCAAGVTLDSIRESKARASRLADEIRGDILGNVMETLASNGDPKSAVDLGEGRLQSQTADKW